MSFFYTLVILPFEQLISICFNAAFSFTQNPGLSVIFLSIIVSTLILPLYMIAEILQQTERNKQKQMQKLKDHIRTHAKGDKKYMLLSALYRQNNYHPIYALRSSLGILIQVPFFIAAYQYLSHLEIFSGQSFIIIKDLSAPDKLLAGINILPVLMTVINIISGYFYTKGFSRQDKIQVYALAILFLVLLYNSPSALVLYWTCNNVYNLLKNIIFKKEKSKKIINTVVLTVGTFLIIYSLFFYKGLLINRLLNAFLIGAVITLPFWKRLYIFLRNKFNYFMSLNTPKTENIILYIIALLPPNIFLFYLLIKHVEYVYYTHFLILAFGFSVVGFIMHFIICRIIKSKHASSLLCVFFWILFFTIRPLHRNYKTISFLNQKTMLLFIALMFIIVTSLLIIFGRRLKNISFYKIFAIFLTVIFSINFIQATFTYIQGKYTYNPNTVFKTSFSVDTNTPSPNIYWLFTDNMLGFKVMESYFDDPQFEFKNYLIERGFIINSSAELETGMTKFGIPALMSPYFYDKVMLPVLKDNPLDYSVNLENIFPGISHIELFQARLNNEFINAFNAKDYNTVIIGDLGLYFMPITKTFYFENYRTDYDIDNIKKIIKFDKLHNIIWLLYDTTPVYALKNILDKYLKSYLKNNLILNEIDKNEIDKNIFYGDLYKEHDRWHIDALSEVFTSQTPRMTIIVDNKNHISINVNEDGSSASETNHLSNYHPNHKYARFYFINLIDFILKNDNDAIIVIQSDHGFGTDKYRPQILASGGTAEDVRLIHNQVMSAVRIPEIWGGLEKPLHPLNITRELVNRYVGENYDLISE